MDKVNLADFLSEHSAADLGNLMSNGPDLIEWQIHQAKGKLSIANNSPTGNLAITIRDFFKISNATDHPALSRSRGYSEPVNDGKVRPEVLQKLFQRFLDSRARRVQGKLAFNQ